jgi:diguanylate cyclase (GGDEF)-like protein
MQDLRKGMRLGADDYLTKPVLADELIATVNTRLEKHQQMTRHYKDELEQTKYHLEISRNYDEVTGLPKRNLLKNRLKDELNNQSTGTQTALLIIKFNRFNNITDIFGKDDYLTLVRELVSRIEKACGRKDNVYFQDDDEFGILLEKFPLKHSPSSVAEKVLSQIRKPIRLKNHELNLSASIGIAYTDNDFIEPSTVISNAEIAVNAAHEDGFNTYKLYVDDLRKHAFDRLNLESALHKALDRNEFTIYYQPKIDSRKQSIIGSEALIRWNNTDYGLLSPTQFVPIAEENGLIIPIGEWVFESICNQLNDWKSAGLNPAPVAVNISARQLEHKGFVNSIAKILERTQVENELLEIELTESILIKNSEKNSKKLVKLRKKGMKVSIDDFGTGYSSLSYLSNFPFDKLKIDQSFIRDITVDKNAASLATSIISMAHKLGVRVIAEGVETKEQLKLLKNHNCDEIQGYYFSKPLPVEDFTELIKKQNPTV